MRIIYAKDKYVVKSSSLINSGDFNSLIRFYQPIIGFKATGLYISLFDEISYSSNYQPHENILKKMAMFPGDFVDSIKKLEALGLVKTFFKKEGGDNLYSYLLYSPKNCKYFFENVLLRGMFINNVGEEYYNEIINRNKYDVDVENMKNISSNFQEVFALDLNDNTYFSSLSANVKGDKYAKTKLTFEFDKFFEIVESNSKFERTDFNENQLKEISRLAALFNLDSVDMAFIVVEQCCFDEKDKLSFESDKVIKYYNNNSINLFKRTINGKTTLVDEKTDKAKQLNLFMSKSPIEYFKIKQKLTKIAPSDVKLIDELSKDYGLQNEVINVLIDYVLYTNNNLFSRSLVTKIAGTLKRSDIETAIDAMSFFTNGRRKTKTKIDSKRNKQDEDLIDKIDGTTIPDEDILSLLKSVREKNEKI